MFNIASYQEGFNDGYSSGYEAAKKEYEQKIEVIETHIFAVPGDVKDIDFPGNSRENK